MRPRTPASPPALVSCPPGPRRAQVPKTPPPDPGSASCWGYWPRALDPLCPLRPCFLPTRPIFLSPRYPEKSPNPDGTAPSLLNGSIAYEVLGMEAPKYTPSFLEKEVELGVVVEECLGCGGGGSIST
jgi:hypothetical protein